MYYKTGLKLLPFLAFISFYFLAGCGENSGRKNSLITKEGISVLDKNGLEKIINEENGKVLFLNVWATWCVPCVEEFPDIVKVAEVYRNDKVEILSLSVDLPSDIETKVIPFLQEQNAHFPVYIIKQKESEEIINLLNPEWNGAVPVTLVYNKNREEKVFLNGAQSYETFKKSIESMMEL